jgi:crotonobetainyl-CoA:carnitine CoA-transferase CaiB-like acyl-CoA transferase
VSGCEPLSYRVLDLSRGIAGAYAVRLLADLGGRCSRLQWQVERPGDWPPSPTFRRYFDRLVDTVAERQPLEELLARLPALAASFDLVVTDFSARELPDEGALYQLLRPYNPRIVVANVDHFGRSGPYAHWSGDEYTDYALGGYWALAGDAEREPLRVPGYQAQFHAGQQLALAALAALRHAARTGEGQEVEVTAVEAMVGAHWSTTVAWTHEGRILERTGPDLFEASDGWVFFYRMAAFVNLFILIERPDLIDDPRWNTFAGWRAHAEEIWGLVRDWCRDKRVAVVVEQAQQLRIPTTPMATAVSLFADPQLTERGYFRERDGMRDPGLPYRWDGEDWEAAPAPAALAAALGSGPAQPVAVTVPVTSATAEAGSGGPLSGLLVLELTNNWAGPIAGRHLADLGADVIKIELATKPATRASHYPGREPGKEHWNRSGYFNEMNRNKRSLSLNLATERGRDLFLRLVRDADVVIENNSARVMPNLGAGWDRLQQENPRMVMASISGFGATGPQRDWVAYGSNIEAASGLAAITGYDDSTPYRTGSFVPDPIAGAHAAVGILAALERRDRTGVGAHLDIALIESAAPFMLESLTYYQEHGELMPRTGNADPAFAPTGAYRCAGSDNWIALTVRTNEQWAALCRLIGADPGAFPTNEQRLVARAAVDELVAEWTAGQDQYACARTLQAAGVPAAPILKNWQLHTDPHLWARNAFIPIEHPDTGVLPYPGFPWRFSQTRPRVRCAAPRFAEGNAYVFRRLLGLCDDEIATLYAERVTSDTPEGLQAPVVV